MKRFTEAQCWRYWMDSARIDECSMSLSYASLASCGIESKFQLEMNQNILVFKDFSSAAFLENALKLRTMTSFERNFT